LALNLEDIDIENQKFQVLGKGNKQRWCFYSDGAANVLVEYLNYSRHKSINALFTAQHPVTLKVSRISYHTLHDYWREITNNYPELNGVRIHDLRHTYATERVGLVSLEVSINEQIYLDQLLVATGNETDENATLNLLKSPPKSAKLSGVKLLQSKFDILMSFGDAKRLLNTRGQSSPVFAISYLLGIKLMPRIRNWKDLTKIRSL
jgi:Phage integrase family/Tn3 transposase DDE domain